MCQISSHTASSRLGNCGRWPSLPMRAFYSLKHSRTPYQKLWCIAGFSQHSSSVGRTFAGSIQVNIKQAHLTHAQINHQPIKNNSICPLRTHTAHHRPNVACNAKRRASRNNGSATWGFKFSKGRYELDINGTHVSIPEHDIWMLVVPIVLAAGIAAAVVPFVLVSVVIAAGIAAALSVESTAVSWALVGIISAAGISMLPNLVPFGAYSGHGPLPQLICFGVMLGTGAVGWSAVSRQLSQPQLGAKQLATTTSTSEQGVKKRSSSSSSRGKQSKRKSLASGGPVVLAESRVLYSSDDEDRVAEELKEFDFLMSERERKRQLAEQP